MTTHLKPISRQRVVRMSEVCNITSLKPARIYELIASKTFPPPFKIVPGGRAAGWWESDVIAWLESRASSAVEE